MSTISLVGMRVGRLVVLSDGGVFKEGRKIPVRMFLCRCDCGNEKVVSGYSLRKTKPTSSCGCIVAELNAERCRSRATHGKSRTSEYVSWRAMLSRCYNENLSTYRLYGGRGIMVCDRWRNSFENFYADMGDKPSSSASLDRKDNDDNYCPENCRWADSYTQAINRSTNNLLEYGGRTMRISEWAEEMGANVSLLCKRFNRGWSVEEVLSTPPGSSHSPGRELISFDGVSLTITEWSKKAGLSVQVLMHRLKAGWSLRDTLTKPLTAYHSHPRQRHISAE